MDAVLVITCGICWSHGMGAASHSLGVRWSEGGRSGWEVTGQRACRASLPAWSRVVRAGSDAGTWKEEVCCVWGTRVGGEAVSVRGRAQGGWLVRGRAASAGVQAGQEGVHGVGAGTRGLAGWGAGVGSLPGQGTWYPATAGRHLLF